MKARYASVMALMGVVSVLGMSPAHGASRPDNDWDGHRLEGSWVFQISLQDCSSGAPVGLPFKSLLTFARGGTVTESTSNAMFFPAVRGPGHGVWKQAGFRTYNASTTAFITVNGALTRTQTIAQTIEVGGNDTLRTTAASVKFYQPDGSLLATGCATASGTRIELEEEH